MICLHLSIDKKALLLVKSHVLSKTSGRQPKLPAAVYPENYGDTKLSEVKVVFIIVAAFAGFTAACCDNVLYFKVNNLHTYGNILSVHNIRPFSKSVSQTIACRNDITVNCCSVCTYNITYSIAVTCFICISSEVSCLCTVICSYLVAC